MLTTIALATQVLGLVQLGVAMTPAFTEAAGQVKDLLTSNADPTPELEASIRATLDASEVSLQATQPGDVP